MATSKDQDRSKGAVEETNEIRLTIPQCRANSDTGIRIRCLKSADTDFPEPGGSPEHSGEPEDGKKPECCVKLGSNLSSRASRGIWLFPGSENPRFLVASLLGMTGVGVVYADD